MGRKRPVMTHDQDPKDTRTWEPEPVTEHLIDPEDAAIDEVFSDFPQNEACIELFRTNPQGGRPMFLEKIAPSVFDFAYVTEKYGGGKYMAKGKYKDGSKVRMPFDIEGDPFPVKRIIPSTTEKPTTVHVMPGYTEPAPEGDNSNVALLSLMRAMMSEMKNSETGFLEKLRLYKELFAPPVQPTTPIETAINMFQKGVEMAGMAEGGGGPWWLPILRELKEPLSKIVDTVQMSLSRQPLKPAPAGSPVTAPNPALASPAGAPAPEPPQQPLSTMEPDQVMLLQIKAILPMLINGAAKNTDPAVYLDFVLDQLPVSAYDSLRAWLLKPECLEQLAQIEPGIRFQQEWWNGLRSGLIEALNEELGHAVRPIHPSPNPNPTTEPPSDHDEVS